MHFGEVHRKARFLPAGVPHETHVTGPGGRWGRGRLSHQFVLLSAASSPLHNQPTLSSRPCHRRSAVSSPHEAAASTCPRFSTCTSARESLGLTVCVCTRADTCMYGYWEGVVGSICRGLEQARNKPFTFYCVASKTLLQVHTTKSVTLICVYT